MWILPKQLISAFAPGTEALTLDSSECSQTCERSLMRRSKPSQSKIYLREWKAGNLMRLRSGAISSPSLGNSFLDWWTSSLAATRVSHSAQPESEQEQTTQDTSGHTSQKEFAFSSQPYAYLKMSKAILRWDSPQLSVIWKKWVTRCRGEYSQRLNAARLTSAKESSSWPTIRASEYKGCGPLGSKSHQHMNNRSYLCAVAQERTGQTGRLNPSWCEWLMGVPIGWTECASLATESYQPQQP